MRRLLTLAVLVAACGGDDSLGPPPPPGFDAAGDWSYTEQLQDRSLGITCNDHGILTLAVTGSTVTGSGLVVTTCTGPGGTVSDSGVVPITAGTLSGAAIAFHVDVCTYSGTLYTSGGQVLASGTTSCDVDAGGPVVHLRGSWHATYVVDVTPPIVSGARFAPVGDTAAVPGDTLTVAVHATDGRRVAFVGYAVGAPVAARESIAVSGAAVDAILHPILPPATTGIVTVKAFARDSAGFYADTVLPPLRIIDMLRRRTRALTIPAPVTDVTVDTKRGLVYLAYHGRSEIGVVNLGTGTFAPPIATTFRPRKLDMNASGDSLVASVDSQPALGIVNLTVTPRTITVVRVDSAESGGLSYVADNVRVMANNKVIVTLAFRDQYSCCSAYHVDYDLGTGLSTRRVDSDHRQWLARSWDRTRMATATGSSTPVRARVYVAASDSFGPAQYVTIPVWLYNASADSTGGLFLLANALFDGNLNALRSFTDTAFQQGGGTVLSPDGTVAYLATYGGYLKVRTSDGAVLERVRLPLWAFQLAITPDGRTLIALGGGPTYFDPPNNQVLLISLQ